MKKHLSQLLLVIPLVAFAGAVLAFTPPGALPPNANTAAPINVAGTDQVKAEGLSVTTFQSREGSYFAQDTFFTGMIRGGTPADRHSSVSFGDETNETTVTAKGTVATAGYFSSNSLKSGGGLKPLCAQADGTFFICGSDGSSNADAARIVAQITQPNEQTGVTSVFAATTKMTGYRLTATIGVAKRSTVPPGGGISYIRNMFTAHAIDQSPVTGPGGGGTSGGNCPYTTTRTSMGQVTIYAGEAISNSIPVTRACNINDLVFTIIGVTPDTIDGEPILLN